MACRRKEDKERNWRWAPGRVETWREHSRSETFGKVMWRVQCRMFLHVWRQDSTKIAHREFLLWARSSCASSLSHLVAAGQAGISQSVCSSSWCWWRRTGDARADPKSIRNLFVSSTAALPGLWGKWCLSLGTAAKSCLLLAGLCQCYLGEQHKDKPREGLVAVWLPSQPSASAVLASRFLHGFWPCQFCWGWVSQHLLMFWIQISVITALHLAFWLLGVVWLTTNWSLCAVM